MEKTPERKDSSIQVHEKVKVRGTLEKQNIESCSMLPSYCHDITVVLISMLT